MGKLLVNTPCPGCNYNLRGLPKRHQCPECGLRFDFESPAAPSATVQTLLKRGRLSIFDKICAVIALLLAVVLMIAGVLGIFTGIRLWLKLPPVLGVLPALAAWGIWRMAWVAWSTDAAARKPLPRPSLKPPVYIPPIYREDVAIRTELLDLELARGIGGTQSESASDTLLESLNAVPLEEDLGAEVAKPLSDVIEEPRDSH